MGLNVDPRESGAARRFSLAGKLTALTAAALLVFAGLTVALERIGAPRWTAALLGFGATLGLLTWAAGRLARPVRSALEALSDGIRSFRDRDFSVRLATRRADELGELMRLYNEVGEILLEERGQIRERELLLQSALDQSPIAIVLVNALGRVVYANRESRRLFLGGARLGGRDFAEIVRGCPEALRQALEQGTDCIFTVPGEDERNETYHVAQRSFVLNRRRHALVLLRRMTVELSRQEAEIWKRVIRVISHEMNNSLAPVSSLAHSGLILSQRADVGDKLETILASIRERVQHLTGFLEGYARFARLPAPRRERVAWRSWLEGLRALYPFEPSGDPPTDGYFDPAQLQQVLINLLKNAIDASDGRPEIEVRVDALPEGGACVRVLDRGCGMTEEVLRRALLPFYSTKPEGSGLGLALCREIVEAHGGTMRIEARAGGGTIVSFRVPPGPG